MKRKSIVAAAFAVALAPGGFGAASAQAPSKITMAVPAELTSLDPHFHNVSTNKQFNAAIFETLVVQSELGEIEPGLAESWELIDDTTWEFKLRPDVQFHNGSEFTSDDVVFSYERIPTIENSPGSFMSYIASVDRVEAVDPMTVRIITKNPDPLLPVYASSIMMLDRETHEGKLSADFSSAEVIVGTGPYQFVSYQPQQGAELKRSDTYWGEQPEFEEVSYRIIADDAARTAALLSGGVDFADQVPASNVSRIESDENFKVVRSPSLRSVYVLLDRSGNAKFALDNDGNPLPENPFDDLRVRQALSLAIDRNAIVERVMEGAAVASGQFMPEGASGYVEDLAVPEANAEEAMRLLAEAGFPDGFRLTLHGPNDQYPNDSVIVQAIGQMWERVGVKTQIVVEPFASFVGKASRQEFSAFLASWGTSIGDASSPLRMVLTTYDEGEGTGSANRGRYSNPEVDALAAEAIVTMDPEKRDSLYQDVTRMAMQDVGFIPLMINVNIAAMKSDIEHVARIDGHVRPQDMSRTVGSAPQ